MTDLTPPSLVSSDLEQRIDCASSPALNVIMPHDDFYIVEKPAGLNFHSEDAQAGFVALAQQQFSRQFYPVHRLDKITSGLVILPTSSASAAQFTQLFSERKINKYYLALSSQKPKKKQGWIKGDMAKSRRGAFKLLKTAENPAITRFYSQHLAPHLRAFLLKPYTGKTHQLRVALKSVGAAIKGDTRYGAPSADRVYLHAFALNFTWQGTAISLTAPPRQGREFLNYWQHIEQIQHWQTPWQLAW